MNVHVREVQKEWVGAVVSYEADRLFDVALRKAGLVWLLLDHLIVPQKWEGRVDVVLDLYAHVVAVGETIVAIEAVPRRQELLLVGAVPLADYLGCVSHVLQQLGDRYLLRVQPEGLPGKQHPAAVEGAEAYPSVGSIPSA